VGDDDHRKKDASEAKANDHRNESCVERMERMLASYFGFGLET